MAAEAFEGPERRPRARRPLAGLARRGRWSPASSRTRSACDWSTPTMDRRDRPDMHPQGAGGFRAAIVARARFIEDLVVEEAATVSPSMWSWVRASIPLPNAGRTSPLACGCSRSTSLARKPGSEGVWSRWATAFPIGCGWSRLISRPMPIGGRSCRRPVSTPASRQSCRFHRGRHVFEQGGRCGHAAPDGRAGTGLEVCHELHAAAGPAGRSRSRRPRSGSPRRWACGTPFLSFYRPEEMLALAHRGRIRRRPARVGCGPGRALLRQPDGGLCAIKR